MKRQVKSYTDEFKRQIVEIFKSGRTVNEISGEYGISTTTVRDWTRQHSNSGKFGVAENRTKTDKELILLRKENKQLKMENDILKQAALILGRKDV